MRRAQPWTRLRNVELFEGCPTTELAALDRLYTELRLPAGTRLITQGSLGHEVFVVLDGEVAVMSGEAELARVGTGGVVGEMALLHGAPRNADVVAASPVRLLVQNRREFATLLNDHPRVGARVRDLATVRAA